jgi:hypothetical protein
MRKETVCFLTMTALGSILLMTWGCDLFEDDGDWDNDVAIMVYNESDCLFTLYIDGINEGSMNPGEEYESTDVSRGIHFLEAYPWNDRQFSCEEVFTPYLQSGQRYEWIVTNEGDCGDCLPTPTPPPETPTPSPTVTP